MQPDQTVLSQPPSWWKPQVAAQSAPPCSRFRHRCTMILTARRSWRSVRRSSRRGMMAPGLPMEEPSIPDRAKWSTMPTYRGRRRLRANVCIPVHGSARFLIDRFGRAGASQQVFGSRQQDVRQKLHVYQRQPAQLIKAVGRVGETLQPTYSAGGLSHIPPGHLFSGCDGIDRLRECACNDCRRIYRRIDHL